MRHPMGWGVLCALASALLWPGAGALARPAPRAAAPSQQSASPVLAVASASTYRAILDRYCVTCHNSRLRTANLALDAVALEPVGPDAAVLGEGAAQAADARDAAARRPGTA